MPTPDQTTASQAGLAGTLGNKVATAPAAGPLPDPTAATWVDPTTNVDGSPVTSGEITGYEVGVRDTTAAGSAPGVYPYGAKSPSTATSEMLSLLNPALPKGVKLAIAVRANTAGLDASGNPINSDWTAELTFVLSVPAPVPNPPTGFTVA